MTQTRKLGDLLKTAAVAAVPAAAAPVTAPAAPVKTAAAPAAPVAAAPVKTARAKVEYDPSIIKTAAQLALLERGMLIPDEKIAEAHYALIYAQEQEAVKTAEQEKVAVLEEQGKHLYRGMMKESAATELALGKTKIAEVSRLCGALQLNLDEVVKLARVKKAEADGAAAATGSDVLFSGDHGSAARPTSEAQMAANRNGNTTEFTPAAVAGTRAPTSTDPIAGGMSGSANLPGNPGLNHGQAVDGGRAG